MKLRAIVSRWVHQDHLTGTALMTDTSGNQVGTTMKYYPFGSTRSGPVPTDKKFTGQRLDGTGLYYYGARYYDQEIGRFISPDPIVSDVGNPQAFDRYSYVLMTRRAEFHGLCLWVNENSPVGRQAKLVLGSATGYARGYLHNPLKYTDSSGREWEAISGWVGETVQGILDAAANVLGAMAAAEAEAEAETGQQLQEQAPAASGEAPQIAAAAPDLPGGIESGVGQIATVAGFVGTSPNTALGLAAGALSGGTPRMGPQATVIFENVQETSLTGGIMTGVLKPPATALTLGHVILTREHEISGRVLRHELGHVMQYDVLGCSFLPVYFALYAVYGYANHPLEPSLP